MDGGARLLDHPGLDTYLARLLHARGEVELPVLQGLLAEARAARGQLTLARALLRDAALPLPRVEAALAELAGEESLGVSAQTRAAPRGEAPLEIEGYQVLGSLGAGGMGAVYRARHKATGTLRAIKVLSGVHDGEDVLRFRREAEGHARVDAHPNVVRVHSFGESPSGLYLVLDLVAGGTLTDYLEERAPSPLECARLVRELCGGLEHAHAQGVLHRDLKPANVLMAGEVPMLADFGLAKVLGEASLTVTGTILGTPAYMAPEQIDGAIAPVGPATDVYGAGAVLYRCLTGRAPFVGRSAVGVMGQVLQGELTAPRSLAPEVPPALEQVCLKALARSPAQRFPSAAAFGAALDEVLSGGAPEGSGRRPLLALALGLGALSLLGVALLREPPAATPTSTPEERVAASAPSQTPLQEDPAIAPPPSLPLQQAWVPVSEEPGYGEAKRAQRREALEPYLKEPLTGKVRGGPARHLAKLLMAQSPTPEDRRRSRALLFESVLQGDDKALDLLAAVHLGSQLQSELAKQGMALPSLARDDELAMAAVYLRTHEVRDPDDSSMTLFRTLAGGGVQAPESRPKAYVLIWGRYRAEFPARAAALTSSQLPELPLAAGDLPERVQALLRAVDPDDAALERELFDGERRLRREVALALARARLGSASFRVRKQGLELLFEAALRGEREAAHLLCLGHASKELVQAALAEAGESLASERIPLPTPRNPELAAAAGVLAARASDPGKAKLAKKVLERLRAERVTPPSGEALAYAQLRDAFLGRR